MVLRPRSNLVNGTNSAKAAGVVVMNEIGVDPGVDHLYALKTINEVHAEGGKVRKKNLNRVEV